MPITKYSPDYRKELLDKFHQYIEITISPMIQEFAYINDIPVSSLYGFEEFAEVLKKCTLKREMYLLKQLEENKNIIASMFLLKTQFKYRENDPVPPKDNNNNDLFRIEIQGKSAGKLLDTIQDAMNKRRVDNQKRIK